MLHLFKKMNFSINRYSNNDISNGGIIMKTLITIALLALVTACGLTAQNNNSNGVMRDTNAGSRERTVFSYWGVGFSQEQIPAIASGGADGVAAKGSVNADLLGFYWPMSDPHMAIGIVSNGALDSRQLVESEFDLTRFSTSGSVLYFPQGEVGDGFYVRGDLGLSGNRLQTVQGDTVRTKLGVGILLGLGYAVPVAEGTKLMLGAGVNVRRVGTENYGGLGVTVGTLF